MEKILVNKIRCKRCNDVIESTHRHDFKFCKCGVVCRDRGRPAVSGACAVRIMKKLYDIDMEETEGPRSGAREKNRDFIHDITYSGHGIYAV